MSAVERVPAGAPSPIELSEKKDDTVMNDIEIQKAPAVPVETTGGSGKMEAVVAVFGSRGKLIIIGAYVFPLFVFDFPAHPAGQRSEAKQNANYCPE